MHQEIKATVIWLALAFFLTFAGFWQAKVAVASASQARHRDLPPPAKTKHAVRPPPTDFTGDVVEDYIARCEKGMTDQEIGWILEDINSVGLNQEAIDPAPQTIAEIRDIPAEPLFKLRLAQHHWYLNSLAGALHLTAAQRSQASSKLAELFQAAKARFNANSKLTGVATDANGVGTDLARQDRENLVTPTLWLVDQEGAYLPSNLCNLSPPQQMLTWKEWFGLTAEERTAAERRDIPWNANSRFLLSHPRNVLQTFETDPFLPAALVMTDVFLPFIRGQAIHYEQRDPFDELPEKIQSELLTNARHLHPSQLKLLLLLEPQQAGEIQTAMDRAARSVK